MARFKNIFLVLCGLVLLFIGINRMLFMTSSSIEIGSSWLISPFLVIQNYIVAPISAWFNHERDINEMRSLLDYYKKDQRDLHAQLIEFHGLKTYAQSIDELKQFAKRYKTDTSIVAQILLKHLDEQNQYMLIDAGSLKGIEKDMVAVHKNCLLGRVVEVYPTYSKVLLLTDKTCKVAAYCSSNGVVGIHVGSNNPKLTELTFVNHLQTVNPQDLVLSSGEGVIFPKGFGIGRIEQVSLDGFTYTIQVAPLIDINDIDYCYIIAKGAELKDGKA